MEVLRITGGSPLRWVAGPQAKVPTSSPAREVKVASVKPELPRETVMPKGEPARPAIAHGGVMIQIGATDDSAKAQDLLARAKAQNPALSSAHPFTEKVSKGGGTLWRARFALNNENQAEAACKSLKKTGFACFTTKN